MNGVFVKAGRVAQRVVFNTFGTITRVRFALRAPMAALRTVRRVLSKSILADVTLLSIGAVEALLGACDAEADVRIYSAWADVKSWFALLAIIVYRAI